MSILKTVRFSEVSEVAYALCLVRWIDHASCQIGSRIFCRAPGKRSRGTLVYEIEPDFWKIGNDSSGMRSSNRLLKNNICWWVDLWTVLQNLSAVVPRAHLDLPLRNSDELYVS